jgi:hypothetical protein
LIQKSFEGPVPARTAKPQYHPKRQAEKLDRGTEEWKEAKPSPAKSKLSRRQKETWLGGTANTGVSE